MAKRKNVIKPLVLFKNIFLVAGLLTLYTCTPKLNSGFVDKDKIPFLWSNSTIYFLLTDRFYNAEISNDFKHAVTPSPLRGYHGGDIKGVTQKIKSGYFTKLGVNVLWLTPLTENIHGYTDEGTGVSFGFHGYWPKDWTSIDKRLGSASDVREMVKTAHENGIKIMMDVIINHTGPVTPLDPLWPKEWVRTSPRCVYKDYSSTISCTLVDNLPDILTESVTEVKVPEHLQNKWKEEGRFEEEMASLETFFQRTGYPRLPYYYIIKWIVDLIEEFGIDGFRVDTVKHVEEFIWKILKKESSFAFEKAKKKFPTELDKDAEFYMLGEVYGYNANNGKIYDFPDKKVDYFYHGFDALINFGFTHDAKLSYRELFAKYGALKAGSLKDVDIVHYVSSHDDGNPFDKNRQKALESGTKLLLTPGIAQIYYGDEVARPLNAEASGDAVLRSPFDWKGLEDNDKMICLDHWQKLGQFRKNNPAVGAGKHIEIANNIFGREILKGSFKNKVVFGIDLMKGEKKIPVGGLFKDGDVLYDYYSKGKTRVKDGMVILNNPFSIVLLSKAE
jgi:alpha-amylase